MVELFTGKQPTPYSLAADQMYVPPTIPLELGPVSEEMRVLVASMLARKPEDRPKLATLIDRLETTWNLKEKATREDLMVAFLKGIGYKLMTRSSSWRSSGTSMRGSGTSLDETQQQACSAARRRVPTPQSRNPPPQHAQQHAMTTPRGNNFHIRK